MRFLISSVVLLLCCSCSLKTTQGWVPQPVSKSFVENLYFSNPETDYTYKAKINLYGKNFSGILVIKKTGTETHRVAFVTEFGNKIFDFLYQGDTFTKNFVLPDLDKKLVVNTLKKDFRLLIMERSAVVQQYTGEGVEIYKTEQDNRFNFYVVDVPSQRLQKIINTSKSKEKVTITFISENTTKATDISIEHENIKLKIELVQFSKN